MHTSPTCHFINQLLLVFYSFKKKKKENKGEKRKKYEKEKKIKQQFLKDREANSMVWLLVSKKRKQNSKDICMRNIASVFCVLISINKSSFCLITFGNVAFRSAFLNIILFFTIEALVSGRHQLIKEIKWNELLFHFKE